jgi:hypothetical protein
MALLGGKISKKYLQISNFDATMILDSGQVKLLGNLL